MTVALSDPKTMPPPTGYSQIAEVTRGKIVLIAGQVAHDTAENLVGENDFAAQAEQVFKNVDAAVKAAGGTFHDIVKINNYCVASVASPSTLYRGAAHQHLRLRQPPGEAGLAVRNRRDGGDRRVERVPIGSLLNGLARRHADEFRRWSNPPCVWR